MQAARRPFRIERMLNDTAAKPVQSDGPDPLLLTILGEIQSLRQSLGERREPDRIAIEAFRAEIAEAQKLKVELDDIYDAINRTKSEIATLHRTGFDGSEMARVSGELDAVVSGTEQATEQILAAAEAIEERAGALAATLSGQNKEAIADISERVITIFEACNFQDLTGQRIAKVVGAFSFIEERVLRMMEIWGGIESFRTVPVDPDALKQGDDALLNGPALEGEIGVASQDDIDALFA